MPRSARSQRRLAAGGPLPKRQLRVAGLHDMLSLQLEEQPESCVHQSVYGLEVEFVRVVRLRRVGGSPDSMGE